MTIGSDERDEPHHIAAFVERHAAPAARVQIVAPTRGNRRAFARCQDDLSSGMSEIPLNASLDAGSTDRSRLLHFQRRAKG